MSNISKQLLKKKLVPLDDNTCLCLKCRKQIHPRKDPFTGNKYGGYCRECLKYMMEKPLTVMFDTDILIGKDGRCSKDLERIFRDIKLMNININVWGKSIEDSGRILKEDGAGKYITAYYERPGTEEIFEFYKNKGKNIFIHLNIPVPNLVFEKCTQVKSDERFMGHYYQNLEWATKFESEDIVENQDYIFTIDPVLTRLCKCPYIRDEGVRIKSFCIEKDTTMYKVSFNKCAGGYIISSVIWKGHWVSFNAGDVLELEAVYSSMRRRVVAAHMERWHVFDIETEESYAKGC